MPFTQTLDGRTPYLIVEEGGQPMISKEAQESIILEGSVLYNLGELCT